MPSLAIVVTLSDEVMDLDRLRLLSVPVDTAATHNQTVGVPRDLEMDHPGAVVLKDRCPRRAASGGQKDADGALSMGSVWNAALTLSRSFESIPPNIVWSRPPSVSLSAARTPCSQSWVARYSVKMITRSSHHFPPGRIWSLEPADRPLDLGVKLGSGFSAHDFISLSSDQFLGDGRPEEAVAGSVESLVEPPPRPRHRPSSPPPPRSICRWRTPRVGLETQLSASWRCEARSRAARAYGGRRRGWRRASPS